MKFVLHDPNSRLYLKKISYYGFNFQNKTVYSISFSKDYLDALIISNDRADEIMKILSDSELYVISGERPTGIFNKINVSNCSRDIRTISQEEYIKSARYVLQRAKNEGPMTIIDSNGVERMSIHVPLGEYEED